LQRSRTGSRRRGKKGERQVEREYLDHALAGFSGYIAADELYDGPFCVLSIVDNRNFRRLTYQVLDHSPTAKDITRFLGSFKKELDARGLVLRGITTDGSALYPQPIALVFGTVRHQICQFHVIKELTHAVLHAVAKLRKQLAAKLPALPRGRPSKANRRQVAGVKRQQQRIADLFEHRHLFVMHHLTETQRRTLLRITRGLPQLRTLRQIMEEVYGLFDRRCRSETALAKLAKLRRRVRCFKKIGKALQRLFSPNLEKALTFLDDKLLPSTSNAVERGNRRHRKMQKSVYRVRTRQSLHRRMALDLLRETQGEGRSQATVTLHAARAASG
jgi:transposase